jgi:hypothetical protein
MKNVTLAIDEADLKSARRIAAERDTSVNALIRDYLHRLATENDRLAQARRKILALSRASTAKVGAKRWKREDLYER